AEPRFLHDLVGDGARADERQRDPAHCRAVSIDEGVERVLVTAAEGRDERRLAAQGLGTKHPFESTCPRACNAGPPRVTVEGMRVSRFTAGWRTGLSRPVLILQAGNALNYFGYGLVLPFEIIYLHEARGFSTATAGLVLAATMGTSALVTPPTGALLD